MIDMSNNVDISIDFSGLKLSNPVLTVSGTCVYADELSDFMDVNCLGGFITKSISLRPRKGNPPPRIVETDSGMLNAIGWANLGLDRFIEEKLPVIRKMAPAVFVNVAGETIADYMAVVERLADESSIAGFELNISCPNVEHGGVRSLRR
jgi:dihydroorotate dehydrogenase (NAD+) catalytic subunit